MKVKIGNRELEMDGPHLTRLKDSSPIRDDKMALRMRLAEDGYLFIRGFHDREKVLKARQEILQKMEQLELLDSQYPLDEAVIAAGTKGRFFGGTNQDLPAYLDVVNAPEVMQFFAELLEGPVVTYDYKWLRAVGAGDSTGIHYDIVYMGRWTSQLYTLWTPFGDTPIEMGTLAICLGSQHFDHLKHTYGKVDVDRDNIPGWFSKDPIEIVERFGGTWATADFQAGDAILFGMYLLHGSTENMTQRFRISCDTRYQLASEPIDERWTGERPKGHTKKEPGEIKDMVAMRKEWGL